MRRSSVSSCCKDAHGSKDCEFWQQYYVGKWRASGIFDKSNMQTLLFMDGASCCRRGRQHCLLCQSKLSVSLSPRTSVSKPFLARCFLGALRNKSFRRKEVLSTKTINAHCNLAAYCIMLSHLVAIVIQTDANAPRGTFKVYLMMVPVVCCRDSITELNMKGLISMC